MLQKKKIFVFYYYFAVYLHQNQHTMTKLKTILPLILEQQNGDYTTVTHVSMRRFYHWNTRMKFSATKDHKIYLWPWLKCKIHINNVRQWIIICVSFSVCMFVYLPFRAHQICHSKAIVADDNNKLKHTHTKYLSFFRCL